MFTASHKNKHLTYNDRIKIEALHRRHSVREIAEIIGVHPSTIYRELKRGQCTLLDGDTWKSYVAYSATIAQNDYDQKATAKGADLKIGNDHAYINYLQNQILENGYSPAAALSKAQQEGFSTHISKTTCYRYIQKGYMYRVNYKDLPRGGVEKKKAKTHRVNVARPDHRSIEQRSKQILERLEFGHWEMDSIVGKRQGKNESCLVLTERKTRQEIIIKAKEKTATSTVAALESLRRVFKKSFPCVFKTITVDNGSEFADQNGIEKLGTTVFYCHPNCPSERGTNENQNKMVRRKFPKGKSLKKVKQTDCRAVQNWINTYPRPMFKGRCSQELFFEELKSLNLQNLSEIFAFFT